MKQHQKYTKEWLEELCKNSFSIGEVLSKAGRNTNGGGNYSHLKQKIEDYKIDISHFNKQKNQGWSKGLTKDNNKRIADRSKNQEISNEKIFTENSLFKRTTVRRKIINQNLISYKCNSCGNLGEWLGQKMPLELDHINGINNDNRLENLRFLCPNCHSITETFSGKNNKTDNDGIGIHSTLRK